MKSFNIIFLFFIIFFLFNPVIPSFAQDEPENAWLGTLGDGRSINKEDLKKIVEEHKRWFISRQKTIEIPNEGVSANLSGATLWKANLQGATLWEANLQGANLWKANLQEANLVDANLQGANLRGCIFEIKPENLPNISFIAGAKNLSQLIYKISPHALVELRKAFKNSGQRRQEREITYAIKRSGFENAWPETGVRRLKDVDYYKTLTEVCLGWFFFELTCAWGMSPVRPLGILIVLMGFFLIPYTVSIRIRIKKDGIWKVWIPERVRTDLGGKKPELLRLSGVKAVKTAFYFSVLSAFNIGWRDLNVGGWIARIQPREYRLQATGWVRSVSGIQSLISVYLLALSFLTYFGRPFEFY